MKSVYTVIFSFLFLSISHGQFSLAPSFGINLSTLKNTSSSPQNYTVKNGIYAGVQAKYSFTDRLGIILEGQYSQKGFEGTLSTHNHSFEARINYIDILAGIEYKILSFLSFNAGINNGIELSEYYKTPQDAGRPKISIFESPNLGTWFGTKIHLNKLFLKFHYNHGLTNLGEVVHTDANGNITGTSDQFDRTYQVGIGYFLF
ncbi:outer membrane beta-barrel protein [Membranihabitans maritimus]|uniref:outer membrane beta-barrel protein n=1 Tax=Membranihabitans maritimus TaxID=2904244 RepID=UPI001F3A6BA6|nr:outer membrane beta-barrel protein [Membranihabitans maritimus]